MLVSIFEWYMARLVAKNGHKKDTCYSEIALCAQYEDTVLGLSVNIIGMVYVI